VARQALRKARDLVKDREKLARLAPGGEPARPLVVESPAVIELRATGEPCIQCEGAVALVSHDADTVDGELLRVVTVRCRTCGTPRTLWFRVELARPN
jgi:hypothetical protein